MRSATNIYGNPFSPQRDTKFKDLIIVKNNRDAVEGFINWLITDKHKDIWPQKRAALLKKLRSGELKGKDILYYRELGEPSHATALDYLINKYNWNNINSSENDLDVPSFQLESNNDRYSKESIEELDNLMKSFLDKLGVKYESTEVIKDKFGNDIPEAVAISRISDMTMQVIEGRKDVYTLPEEAAHFYVALLDKSSAFYKSMMNKIVSYPEYASVKESYKDKYTTEESFREEAIGKIIAQRIVNKYSDNQQVNTWWSILWNYIKKLFSKTNTDPYVKAAYDILNKNVVALKEKSDSDDLMQLYKRSDKAKYEYAINEWNRIKGKAYAWGEQSLNSKIEDLVKAFGGGVGKPIKTNSVNNRGENMYVIPISKPTLESFEKEYSDWYNNLSDDEKLSEAALLSEQSNTDYESRQDAIKSNNYEVRKEGSDLDITKISDNFDELFPSESWRSEEERKALSDAVNTGEIQLTCNI